MSQTKYTQDHEWAEIDGDIITVGITDFAQSQLGDIVYIELPDVGRTVDKGEETCVVESVKAAGEVKSPVTGEIIEVNDVLNDEPELANQAPETDAWFFKIKPLEEDELSELIEKQAYDTLVESLS